jgi:ABC-type phosphate transport system substrate-binding protein
MVNLALAWAEEYQVVDPSVDIAVTGGGSGTGIASLMNGTVDIANASRAMKQEEIEDAQNTDIFAPQTLLMPSSVGITSEVQRNPNAIGYDGLGYVNPEHEKVLAISKGEHPSFTLPSVETAASGIYPLSRNLYMYTAGVPTGSVADYLNWILSNEGQLIVAELGFVPLGLNE